VSWEYRNENPGGINGSIPVVGWLEKRLARKAY